ncbi:NAD(P)H:quinone oxidoreductase [Xanthomonas citri]|uniref:NAD(P)H:quinone oxidoreductase n=1 Tax=Xanthomonas citri TaxID=346 RepID=UPI00052F587B|nr:NAD(P)H:quinone oxidoreductase [Xanthomonas citri]CEH82825.1 Repressor binding protein [Xanthomonas citri pv. citri]
MKRLMLLVALILMGATAMAQEKAKILVLIHSENGGTYELAKEVAAGIQSIGEVESVIKQVRASDKPALKDIPVATTQELTNYDGIAFGSPVYFANPSPAIGAFLAGTVDLWTRHALEGVPATVFMSAGSGAGNELAIQSFRNSLAAHGMVLVPNGIRGAEAVDNTIPQGNTILGATSLAGLKGSPRPSPSERQVARLQGSHFAKVALALRGVRPQPTARTEASRRVDINTALSEKGIVLPPPPAPVGNYTPFARSGNLVFINQVALKDGAIVHAGKVGAGVSDDQAKEATRVTMLNVLAVLKDAVGGDLNRVRRTVQLTGLFNTTNDYADHAKLLNVASDLTVEVFGERGKHARAAVGAASLPVASPVEIQAIFEVE